MSKIIHPTFKAKLVAMICLFHVLSISAVSFLNYQRYSRQLTGQTIGQTQQIIEQTGANINTYLNELNRLTLAPYYNDDVLGILENPPASTDGQLASKRTVEDFLAFVMTLPRDEILRVYIMNAENIYSYTRTPYEMEDYSSYQESTWYRQALSGTKPIYIPPHLEKAFGSKEIPIFSIVRPIRSKNNNNLVLGVIKVDADYSGIHKICDRVELQAGGALLIINDQNQIIYESDGQLSTDFLSSISPSPKDWDEHFYTDMQGRKYIVNHYAIASSGLKIIALNSYEELMQPVRENMQKTIFLASVCIAASVIFFTFFIRKFLAPLAEIIRLMRSVESGDLGVHAPVRTEDEIGYLTISFNTMVDNLGQFLHRNNQLVKEVYETKYLYKEAQYNALYSQIKPHFMYNTLNTISLLIKCGENTKAVRAIESFSSYLGGIMNVDKDIPLENEIHICLAYLSIMQLRYEDKLTYKIETLPGLCQCILPSLSVQPLVENAIKHGCEQQRRETHIEISFREELDGYRILVSDNGPGIPPDKLEELNNRLHTANNMENASPQTASPGQNPSPSHSSIGLINIRKRLSLKFGEKATVSVASSYGLGTTITLYIPDRQTVQTMEEKDNVSHLSS